MNKILNADYALGIVKIYFLFAGCQNNDYAMIAKDETKVTNRYIEGNSFTFGIGISKS